MVPVSHLRTTTRHSGHLPLSERILSAYFDNCSSPPMACGVFPRVENWSTLSH